MAVPIQKVGLILASLILAPHIAAAGAIDKTPNVRIWKIPGSGIAVPFDVPLYKGTDGQWKGDFRAYVYYGVKTENDPLLEIKRSLFATQIATSWADSVLGVFSEKKKTVKERAKLFFSDAVAGHQISFSVSGCDVTVDGNVTDASGMATGTLTVGNCDASAAPREIKIHGIDRENISPSGAAAYPTQDGDFGIITDIDDTIRETFVLDRVKALGMQFAAPFSPVPGMPQLFGSLATAMKTPQVYYVTGCPHQLFPTLKSFLKETKYLPGVVVTRDFSLKDPREVFNFDEAGGIKNFKVGEMVKIHNRHPKKKFVMLGDSAQGDPEAYAEMYHRYPEFVQCIWIRMVDQANNTMERFDVAFKDIPSTKWKTFKDPSELAQAQVTLGECA